MRQFPEPGASIRVIVKKWGNSASVRIPSAVMRAAQLALDDAVDVREEGGCIAIQPLRSQEYNLAQLLSQTTPDNLHVTVDFGAPVGKEVL